MSKLVQLVRLREQRDTIVRNWVFSILKFLLLDLISPIEKDSGSFTYTLKTRDRSTCFLATVPIVDKKADIVKDVFVQNWCGHYGIQKLIMTDNDCQFSNLILPHTFEQLGIENRFAPPYVS